MTNIERQTPIGVSPAGLLPVSLPLVLAALSWAFVLAGSGTGMSVLAMTSLHFPPVSQIGAVFRPWTAVYAIQMMLMWWIMMLAMMLLPLAIFARSAFRQARVTSAVTFLVGYSSVWLLFAIAATGLQWVAEKAELFHPFMMWSISPIFSSALLAGAGLFQLTGLKSRTRFACQTSEFSLASGLDFGKNCSICTGPIMLLFLAGGTMNMAWMVGLTLIVLAERRLDDHRLFDRLLASLLIALGVWSLVA
ncbi:MAG: DUF2182 domain-containing protein [Roseibium sp.]|uniref:DUF2182 domain-containing protein n=1 Tax=Roseibium sp. TaxID=1936156 RepID=UPI00260D7ABB|nr:DUF2182 domain-containing protein [Roseibium sp.]MCV0428037.1 DUF2182 domain-containing protein [Roseibium sp.]